MQFLQNTVKNGRLIPNTVKLWKGGPRKVDEGLTSLRSGKASAEKVVFRLPEHPPDPRNML